MTDTDAPGRVYTQIGPWGLVPAWILDPDLYLPGVPDQDTLPDEKMKLRDSDKKPLNGSELRVYIALRTFSNSDGKSKPFVKTIAARAKLDQSTTERALGKFKRLGWLETKRRYRPDGSIHRCDYFLRDICPGGLPVDDPTEEDEQGRVPVKSRVPSPRTHGSKEHTKRTHHEVKCTASGRSAPYGGGDTKRSTKQSADEAQANVVDDEPQPRWREEDRVLFKSLVGERVKSHGMGRWNEGTFDADAIYDALRRRSSGRKAMEWPGRYLNKLEEDDPRTGLLNWLDNQGFELIDQHP